MFRLGQKVVCVDVGIYQPGRAVAGKYLRLGEVYTIQEVLEFPHKEDRVVGLAVRLVGLVRPDHKHPVFSDYPFAASRFRPVVGRKTDISIFTAMLTPSKRKVRA